MPQFTPDEQRLIYFFARDRGPKDWISFYLAVLTAPIAMAVYGIAQSDTIAMGIAFFGLLVLVAWGISSAARDWKVTKSICVKLTATLPASSHGSE
jgi:hypothetical protein